MPHADESVVAVSLSWFYKWLTRVPTYSTKSLTTIMSGCQSPTGGSAGEGNTTMAHAVPFSALFGVGRPPSESANRPREVYKPLTVASHYKWRFRSVRDAIGRCSTSPAQAGSVSGLRIGSPASPSRRRAGPAPVVARAVSRARFRRCSGRIRRRWGRCWGRPHRR